MSGGPAWKSSDGSTIDWPTDAPILRGYLKRWKAEVGVFFDGVSADSPEADLLRIAPDHPVFRIGTATP